MANKTNKTKNNSEEEQNLARQEADFKRKLELSRLTHALNEASLKRQVLEGEIERRGYIEPDSSVERQVIPLPPLSSMNNRLIKLAFCLLVTLLNYPQAISKTKLMPKNLVYSEPSFIAGDTFQK